MNLFDLYRKVDDVLSKLDFNGLFPGFHRYKMAIYTNKSICLNGVIMPYESDFRGNTAKLHNGEYIAIWNVELDPTEDADMLAYQMVHEMFHCHQHSLNETRLPSDLQLLMEPDDIDYYTLKFNENHELADALEYRNSHAFQKFAAFRSQRLRQHPDLAREELKAETIEGFAEYIGLKALQHINSEKFSQTVQHYLQLLRSETHLQFDLRRISYYTGAVFCLCLDMFHNEIRNIIDSPLTIWEQNPLTTAPDASIVPYSFIQSLRSTLVTDRQAKLRDHMDRFPYTDCAAIICGYDPMNMFRLDNIIYCSHFVALNIGGQQQVWDRAIILVLKEHSINEIKGYY